MNTVSDALRELLSRQGITREGLAGPVARGMKSARRSQDGAAGQVMAAAAGGTPHRPTAGGGPADENSGKDRGNVTPAKFTGLRLVSSRDVRRQNPTSNAPLGLRTSLMLVWSR